MDKRAKTLRRAAVTLTAALAISVGAGASAFAAQPGEDAEWHYQYDHGERVESNGGMTEAHDANGNLVQAWRGYSDNAIYVAANNGAIYRWPANANGGAATTYATPQIVATDYGFRVYHTGTDGRIYYAGLTINAGQVGLLGSWRTVPGVITRNNMAPAVTAMPRGESVYLAYHGATSDQVYGAFFNGFGDDRYNTGWQAPRAIPGVFSPTAPSIAYNNSWNHLVLTWAGTDLQVNYSTQLYGSAYWSTPRQIVGVSTQNSPTVALTDNGAGQIAVTPWVNDGGTWGTDGGGQIITIRSDGSQPAGVRVEGGWTTVTGAPDPDAHGGELEPGSLHLVNHGVSLVMLGVVWSDALNVWKGSGRY